jgi:predicted site-specific integrase-resolvase
MEEADTTVVAQADPAVAASAMFETTTFETANKWSKNGFGAPVEKQSGKFSKEESEMVRKAIEEFCAAKQISTARLCSECDHKVR